MNRQRRRLRRVEELELRRMFAADISVTIAPSVDLLLSGEPASYAITIANQGDVRVDEVVVNHDPERVVQLEWSKQMPFPREFSLGTIGGGNGFAIPGLDAGDILGNELRFAGDVNGDGYGDMLVGAPGRPRRVGSGEVYVIYGNAPGEFHSPFDVAGLDGSNGFAITGYIEGGLVGREVALDGAGDLNGDGLDDIVIGAGGEIGEIYVVYGARADVTSAARIEVEELPKGRGFYIIGANRNDGAGISVAFAGDVNGDGLDDLIIGAPFTGYDEPQSGGAYVLFGSRSGFARDVELSTLEADEGFVIRGFAAGEQGGRVVYRAGDVNADGIDDVAVSTKEAGYYVLFGSSTGFPLEVDVSQLDGNKGFKMVSPSQILRTELAGDINADGVDDLVVGTVGNGKAYVLFGSASGFARVVDLERLDGTDGFTMMAGDVSSFGITVGGTGDVNGDGIDDIVIGALAETAGDVYVVFGSRTGFAPRLDARELDGTNGFLLKGHPDNQETRAGSALSGGDINGDGFGDVLVGADGTYFPYDYEASGQAFVVFGRATSSSGAGAIRDRVGLSPGETVTYVVTAHLDASLPGAWTVTATALLPPNQPDDDPTNNEATAAFTVITPIPGDIDQDGSVAFADFLILSANFGRSDAVQPSDGDINTDGQVDFQDFLILSDNFGRA